MPPEDTLTCYQQLHSADPGDKFVPGTNIRWELRLFTGMKCPHSTRKLVALAADDLLPLEQFVAALGMMAPAESAAPANQPPAPIAA